jgi:hypothetical protein
MMNEIAATTEETTAYALGTAVSTLFNLKRMVEQNMTDYTSQREGRTGLQCIYSKDEVMREFDKAINKLNGIRYPYKY